MKKIAFPTMLCLMLAVFINSCEPFIEPPKHFCVVFDANGGSGSMPMQIMNMENEESLKLSPNTFTRDGYVFAGWNTESTGKGRVFKDRQIISSHENLSLYAQWKSAGSSGGGGSTSGTESGHKWVDLGLPSGLKWATCNVGATKPEGYGHYFAWGETSPKDNYSWSTYKYCNGSYDTMIKYCTQRSYGYNGFTDNKTTLEIFDDAARANWGGKWRMPTKSELQELGKYCDWTWTIQNGVKGYKVKSKTNGNSIFLPAAGYLSGTSVSNVGTGGYYWSSSLGGSYSYYAYHLFFYSDNVDYYYYDRYDGLTVRAVISDDIPGNKATYTVTFNANGGSGTMSAQTFEAGVSQALAANTFTRSGYNFTGWNTSPDGSGTSYTDKQSITLSQDITLYAQWERIKYNLSFDANGGSGTMAAQTFEAGVSQVLAANTFTRSGYTFTGWNTKADGSGTSYTNKQIITLMQDMTLYAQWKKVTYGNVEYAQVNVANAGILEGGTALSAGTVLAQSANVTMTVGADDIYKLTSAVVNDMTRAIVGGASIDLSIACQGSNNPKDADGGNCDAYATVPASGAFFAFDVKKDGYLYVVIKASSNKTYVVSEEGTLIGYDFAMHTPYHYAPWGSILRYTLEGEGEYNQIVEGSKAAANLIWPEKIALGEAWEAAAGEAGRIGVAGTAVIKFPVFAGGRYTVNGCGTKIIASGYFFGTSEETVVLDDGYGNGVVLF